MTKEELKDLIYEKVEVIDEQGRERWVIDLDNLSEIIDKIFEEPTVKDSFNNNTNCIININ